jgi:formylglycine-generating enzyme required for sulfatase activity
MVFIQGRTFLMGSNRHYPEEAPAHHVTVDGFWIDCEPVTNAQFARFVAATGYITTAEQPLDPTHYSGLPGRMLHPGSLVFRAPKHAVPLDDWRNWWVLEPGACWRHPFGPGSSCRGLESHPVVHVAYPDALAYARWAGKDLPREAEWELAARGGLEHADYPWGDVFMPADCVMANTWHGRFPHEKTAIGSFERTSPVRTFPPNGYGLYDMIGNVWEWTCDFFAPHATNTAKPCCVPNNPRHLRSDMSFDPLLPQLRIPRRVIKGGSHLCAPSYCRRYRPAARQGQAVDSPTSHIGFRCVARGGSGYEPLIERE